MPIGIGTAALIGGGVAAAGTLASGIIGSNAAKDAANTSANAADKSLAVQQQQFAQTTANEKPFLDTGTSALGQLAGLYGVGGAGTGASSVDPNATFYQTPDYKFNLSQGIKGVDAGAAARGMLDSGATRKAEIAYGGNLASGQFNNYANRLQSLAGIGQAAASGQAAAGANYANGYTNTVTNAANTQANAGLVGANSTATALNGLAGTAQNYLTNNPNLFGSSYSANGSNPALPSSVGSGNFSPLYPSGGY